MPVATPVVNPFNLTKNIPENHLFNRFTKIVYFFGLMKLFETKN